jgi:glycosyltransferase involved in cell wall biosynthesis
MARVSASEARARAEASPERRPAGRRRKVVMLLENFPYPQDVRVRNEAEALAGAGHEVTVLAPRAPGQPARDSIAGVRIQRYRLPVSGGGMLGFLLEYAVAHLQLFSRGLWRLLRGADVVHLHNPPDTLFPLGLLARALGRAVVFDHHDLFPELLSDKFGSSRLRPLAAAAQRASFRSADSVLVTNRSQAEIALRRGGLAAERVTIVRNGPRRATIADPAPPRGGVLDDPRLVFVGELDLQDGVLSLPLLLAEPGLEKATLTVVGDGAVRERLAAELAAAGVADRVRFTGRVPHSEVPELIGAADICIDPAPCTELNHRSTMIKIAEYLAAGRPVVAFGLDETRHSAGDAALYAECGRLDELARHLSGLAGDERLRAELAARALRRAQELVWERSEEELLAAYERLPA